MYGARELKQNVNFQRRDLRHRLCRMKQLFFGYRLQATSASGVQINSLDEFHVVEKRTERHEIRKTNFVSFGNLQGILKLWNFS